MISHVIKPQVGWRSHDADAELFTPMFRFGYHEGMHKKHHGKTKDKWEKFVSDLFATQDGFIGKEKTTVKALRNQWDARIDRFKALHGWEDGRCQNLSGLEGDLNEPDVTIKMMLEEIQEDEARKEAKDADAKQTEANEVSVIIQGYSNSAKKKKRPFKQVGDSADTSTTDADTSSNTILSAVKSTGTTDFIKRLIDGVTGGTPNSSITPLASSNEEIIAKFAQHLTALGSMDLLCDAYGDCRVMPDSFDLHASSAILESLGYDSIARLFLENMDDPRYIKNELKEYGLDKITETRLYTYIIKMAKEFSSKK